MFCVCRSVSTVVGRSYGLYESSFTHNLLIRSLRSRSFAKNIRWSSEQAARDKWGKGLALRTNCENTYLSWTRNAAICVVVGAGLFVAHAKMPRTMLAGIAFVDLGLLFIIAGSCEHIVTSIKLLQWSVISLPRFVWICSYTGAVLTVWLFGVSQLIGYSDQIHYLSKCLPRLMSYAEVNKTKPK